MITRYTRPQMGRIWDVENKFATWLKVELAICRAWHTLGVIPDADMNNISERAKINVLRILQIEDHTKHDVIAFLSSLEEEVGPSAKYIHLGCTSSDIVDTANSLLLMEAGELIGAGFERLLLALKKLSLSHRGLICMGRTHGMHAEPTSFALKMAGYYEEFARSWRRLQRAVAGLSVGKVSGAVGTYAFLSPELEDLACANLGLQPDPISTQIIQRDRYAAFFTTLAIAGGSVDRLCTELRHLQRTEVGEVGEGFGVEQKGSSAMPHKKNPISAENMSGLARILRGNAVAALENQALWHERDISHSSVERIIMPDSTILMDYIMHRLSEVIENLQVYPENMQRNLESSYQVYYSQRVLTALVEFMPRQRAYTLVQTLAGQSLAKHESFVDLVRNSEEIKECLSEELLDTMFDNEYYIKYESQILQRVFKRL